MIAVIPVFYDQNNFWGVEHLSRELISKIFKTVQKACSMDKVLVFTNQYSILQLAASMNMDAYKLEIQNMEDSRFLPAGIEDSLDYVENSLDLDDAEIIAISYKNPLIKASSIDNAIAQYRLKPECALISTRKITDHPFQLNRYYQVTDWGMIHLFDGDEVLVSHLPVIRKWAGRPDCPEKSAGSVWKITRPFNFDWKSRNIHASTGSGIYFVQHIDNFKTIYLDVNDIKVQTSCGYPVWLYEGPDTARLIVELDKNALTIPSADNPETIDHAIGGVFFGNGGSWLVYSREDSDACRLPVIFLPGDSMLHLVPVTPKGPQSDCEIEIVIGEAVDFFSFISGMDGICGFLYFISELVEEGPYHMKIPFLETEINDYFKRNGKCLPPEKMNGRQMFPNVVEPDRSFCIFNKNQLKDLKDNLRNGDVFSYVLNETESLQIECEFDLLKYKALSRIKG